MSPLSNKRCWSKLIHLLWSYQPGTDKLSLNYQTHFSTCQGADRDRNYSLKETLKWYFKLTSWLACWRPRRIHESKTDEGAGDGVHTPNVAEGNWFHLGKLASFPQAETFAALMGSSELMPPSRSSTSRRRGVYTSSKVNEFACRDIRYSSWQCNPEFPFEANA